MRQVVGPSRMFGWTLASVLSSASIYASESHPAQRDWTPQDSIAVRYFLTRQYTQFWESTAGTDAVLPSPDRERFFFVSYRGDLSCDCNEFELSVFEARSVTRALDGGAKIGVPAPLRKVLMQSRGLAPAIQGAQWEDGGKSIAFLGTGTGSTQRLYSLDVASGKLSALTSAKHNISSLARKGDLIIYDVVTTANASDQPNGYPAHVITRGELSEALFRPDGRRSQWQTFATYKGKTWEIPGQAFYQDGPWLSPNGEWAITLRLPAKKPEMWNAYDGAETARRVVEFGDLGTPQFTLVDSRRRRALPVFDAPAGTATRVGAELSSAVPPAAFWDRDGRYVVLVNTALPIGQQSSSSEFIGMSYVVSFDTQSSDWDILESMESSVGSGATAEKRRVAEVGWLTQGQELLVRHESRGEARGGTVYSLRDGRWQKRSVAADVQLPGASPPAARPTLEDGLSVTLIQSNNEPPRIVAANGKGKMELSQPDPALDNLWRARSEEFQWSGHGGRVYRGGLMQPRNSSQSRLPPLVIQAYYYQPELFRPDGPHPTAYAAQALAARGMVVLNMDIPHEPKNNEVPNIVSTPQELTEFVASIDAAADALAQKGLIDRERVGLVGFSRAGYLIYYAITHPGTIPPAAAVIADSWTGAYSEYLLAAATGFSSPSLFDRQYGGNFWKNKSGWLEFENTFNVDRVRTPALFSQNSITGLTGAYQEIGAFAINNKPLEYLLIPEGSHQLVRPRARLASMEATVDWMGFWLQNYEDAKPEKADKYARWRAMRSRSTE